MTEPISEEDDDHPQPDDLTTNPHNPMLTPSINTMDVDTPNTYDTTTTTTATHQQHPHPNQQHQSHQQHPSPPFHVPLAPPLDNITIYRAKDDVKTLLKHNLVEDLVPRNSKIVVLDVEIDLFSAFQALFCNEVRAAAVIDSTKNCTFSDVLTVSDMMEALIHFHYTANHHDIRQSFDACEIGQWIEIRQRYFEQAAQNWRAQSGNGRDSDGDGGGDMEGVVEMGETTVQGQGRHFYNLPNKSVHQQDQQEHFGNNGEHNHLHGDQSVEQQRHHHYPHQHEDNYGMQQEQPTDTFEQAQTQGQVASHPVQFQNTFSLDSYCIADTFLCADSAGPLYNACSLLNGHRMHRLPIMARGKQMVMTLEHWRVLKHVHTQIATQTREGSPSLLDVSVGALGIGSFGHIVSCRRDEHIITVLERLRDHDLSAVPIVDHEGRICDVYSRADVIYLLGNQVQTQPQGGQQQRQVQRQDSGNRGGEGFRLDMPVGEVLRSIRFDPHGQVETCSTNHSLGHVLERLDRTRKHRLYFVDANGRIEGVLSLSDVLRYFMEGV